MDTQKITLLPDDTEEWRAVVGYEGIYEVSSLGRVRRIHRIAPPIVLRPQRHNKGYHIGRLYKAGTPRHRLFHKLVAEAFIGPCPPGLVVNHRDGNRQNNCVQNLEYCTYSENALHAVASGVWPVGERHCCAKLTARDVEEIRDLCASGVMYQRDIGTAYGITQSNVSRIGRRIGWAHAA